MKVKPTIWVLFTAVLMSVGLTLSDAHARCSPANDYPLNRGESVSLSPPATDVNQAPNAVSVAFNITNVSCYGKKTGSVTAIPSGGVAPYTYVWSNGKTTQTINNLFAGSYSVTVTGAQGSGTTSGTAVVTQPNQIVAYINCTKTCPNQCNGTASVTILSGGAPPYTYQWSTTATTSTINGLCAGTYWVTITDANGCKKIVGAAVLTYPAVVVNGITTNVTCNATCTGTITQTVSGGGGAPFVYNWNDGATTKNRTALCAGTYNVTVTSAKGCTAIKSYTITQTTPPTVTLTPTNPPCYGGTGSINATVSGGTGPYTYLWSNAAITEDISGLGTGSYSITVTDANGCTATATTSISVPTVQLSVVASATGCSPVTACLGTATTAVSNGTAPYTYIWTNGQTGASAGGFCPGVYGVTVTDANQCTATDTVAIGLCPPVPCTFPITITGTAPCGATTAILGVNLSGVPAGYTVTGYAWYVNTVGGTPVATTPTYVGTVGITYCVRVSFSSANQECFAETCTTITPSAGPSVTITGNNPTCYGKNNGNASAIVSGGTGPYTYLWSNGKTTQTINNLVAGTYSVTVTDANGCTASDSHILTQPPQIIGYVNCTKTCPGQCTATIDLTVMGGTPPYTYQWSNTATTQDLANVCAGTYWVTITDANGCKKIVGAMVLTYPAVNVSGSVTQPTCTAPCGGSILLTATGGGGGPFTYLWNNGATTKNLSNLCAGTYSVIVTSGYGCTGTATFTLIPVTPQTCTVTGDEIICQGETSEFCVTAGASYLWSNSATTQCIAVSTAGTYSVTVTSATGCTSTCSRILVVKPLPVCTISGGNFCYGGSSQLCAATNSAYLWSTGATTQCITVNAGGTYGVTVTNAFGCTNSCEKTVTAYPNPTATATTTPTVCNNDSVCTGTINLTVTTGTAPFTYLWNDGATTEDRDSLCEGNYAVTITDANGCTTTTSPDVLLIACLPCEVTVTIDGPLSQCVNGDSITLTAVPGTPAATLLWSNGSTASSITVALSAGNNTYSVTATLDNGTTCADADTITVIGYPAPTCSIVGDEIICLGESSQFCAATASAYLWSTGATVQCITVQTAGDYCVTITDANGCTSTCCRTLVVKPNPTCSISGDNFCYGGSTQLCAATNAAYLWSTGATTQCITVNTGGTYNVTVTNAFGCTSTCEHTVTAYPAPTCAITGDEIICYGETSEFCASAAASYIWSNGATTQCIAVSVGGTYNVTITDANGCTSTCERTLVVKPLPVCTITGDDFCYGYSSELCAATNSAYLWSTGETTQCITVTTGGTYGVTVTNAFGCTNSCEIYIQAYLPPVVTVVASDATCAGICNGSATAYVTGDLSSLTYNWNTNTGAIAVPEGATIDNLCPGVYCVTVTDVNGCSAADCDTVGEPDSLGITALLSDVSCYGACDGIGTAGAYGGTEPYSVLWSNGDTNWIADSLCAGDYCFTVTDANGCTDSGCLGIGQPDSLVAVIVGDSVSCYGTCDGTATVTATGGNINGPYSYAWSNEETDATIDSLCAGVYCVTVTDIYGCTATACVTIGQPTPVTVSSEATDVNCFNDATGTVTAYPFGGTAPYTIEWTTGETTWTITDLVAGEYCFTVTDANGCTASGCDTVNEPEQLLALIVCPCPLALCPGDCSFAADLEVYGGTPPYTYEWSNGATTQDVDSLCEGMYSVTVTDANGCTFDAQTAPFEWADSIEIQIVSTNVSCYGECDGSAGVGATGGYGDLTIAWENGASTWAIDSLCEGTYCFTVTDELGCTAEGCVSIAQPDSLVAIATSTDATCYEDCSGTAYVVATGGTAPYTYAWSNEVLNDSISELCEGEYCVTVTDFNGCTAVVCVNIEDAPELTAIATATNPLCYGGLGSVAASANGGTGDYTYEWSNGATTQTIEGLEAGVYCVTVTDENGCTAAACDTIEIPTEILFATTFQMPTCYGVCDGGIALLVSGGTEPYSFEWSNGATTQGADSLCEGTYCVTVTDANGCVDSICIAVPGPELLTVLATGTNVNCYGDCNGTASAAAAGGTAPYTYAWSDATTTEAIIGLCAGTYYVTATDANGCTAVDTVEITQPDSLLITLTKEDVTCYGACDGSATITVTGGTGDYSYVWNTLVDLDSLCAGTYCVTVYDANQCSATACLIIGTPTQLTVSSESTDVLCFNDATGSITVTANGGTPDYSIVWSNGESTFTITDLVAGIYCYTVTDANGCTASGCDTVNEPEQLLALIVCPCPLALCPGDCSFAADLEVYGGTPPYTYEWSNGATTQDVDSLCEGMYSVTVTDANGCTFDAQTAPFEWADSITATVESTDLNCFGVCDGTASVIPAGGYGDLSILWENGATTWSIDSLCEGEYCFTITDEIGCTYSDCVTLEQPEPLIGSSESTDITCYGIEDGSITVFVSGGTYPYAYAWANGSTDSVRTGLGYGTYQITVTDANGCTIEVTDSINEPAPLTLNVDVTQILCNGDSTGAIYLVPGGGTAPYEIVWDNGATTFALTDLGAGTYCYTITDANGCTIEGCNTLNEPELLLALSVCPTTIQCYGDCDASITVYIQGGTPPYSFEWTDSSGASFGGGVTSDSTTLEGLCAGLYTILITDANGCTYDKLHELLQPDQVVLTAAATQPTVCTNTCDGAIDLTASGGTAPYTYEWNDGTTDEDRTGLCAGLYSATVTDALGCTAVVTDSLIQLECPPCVFPVTIEGPTVSCFLSGPVTLQLGIFPVGPGANVNYAWTGGSSGVTLDVTGSGTYCVTVTVTYPNGVICVADTCHTITIDTCCNVTDGGNIGGNIVGCDTVCPGPLGPGVLPSGGVGELEYMWLYSTVLTNNFNVNDTNWHPIPNSNSASYDPGCLTETRCFIRCSRRSGCEDFPGESNILCVIVGETPTVTASVTDATVCTGNCDGSINITVTGGNAPFTYNWSNGKTTEDVSGLCPGDYSVTVTDVNGCSATVSGNVITVYCVPECTLEASVETIDATECEAYNTCVVNKYGGSDSHAFWLVDDGSTAKRYFFTAPGGTFVQNDDGTAHLTGTVYRSDDTNKKWYVDLWFANAMNWAQWSALGRDYKNEANVAGLNYLNWTYYIFDNTKPNTLTGLGAYAGETLDLQHMPANYEFGLQVGTAANSKDVSYGMSGWFTYTGSRTGHGDINTDNNCTTTECNGAAMVTVEGAEAPITYTWSDNTIGNISNADGLCPGDYCVTVSDVNGCIDTVCFTIECTPEEECGQLRTQTQGGWGQENNPGSGNPGTYMHANFAAAFPTGITIGCATQYTVTLTSAQAVTNYLPAGGTPAVLTQDWTNPATGGNPTFGNNLSAQLLTATINVGFDAAFPDFGEGSQSLSSMYITSGTFAGWTVNQLLTAANTALGGCGLGGKTPSQYSDALTAINENFHEGINDNGFLTCTPPVSFRGGDVVVKSENVSVVAYPNPFAVNATIAFTLATDDNVTLEVYNVTGQKVAELFNGAVNANQTYNVNFDGAQLTDGMYIYRLVTSSDTYTGQLVRVKP